MILLNLSSEELFLFLSCILTDLVTALCSVRETRNSQILLLGTKSMYK